MAQEGWARMSYGTETRGNAQTVRGARHLPSDQAMPGATGPSPRRSSHNGRNSLRLAKERRPPPPIATRPLPTCRVSAAWRCGLHEPYATQLQRMTKGTGSSLKANCELTLRFTILSQLPIWQARTAKNQPAISRGRPECRPGGGQTFARWHITAWGHTTGSENVT